MQKKATRNAPGLLMVLPWDVRAIGGVDSVVVNLYRKFANGGRFLPRILVTSWEDRKAVYLRENGLDKVRLRVRGPLEKGSAFRSLLAYVATLPFELRKVQQLVRQLDVPVVNAHYPTLAMSTFALARWLGLIDSRIVLSFHGTDIRRAAAGSALTKTLWRWLLRQSDAVVAVSQGLAGEILAFSPAVRHKTTVIHNGIDDEEFLALAHTKTHLSESLSAKRVVLEVGAFEPKKGQDLLLRTFAALANKHPALHLLLVGQTGKGSIETEIERLAADLGIAAKCTLLKNAPRNLVAECMQISQIFVLPSRAEPFGLVLLEAGALGVPVVASRVGGIPEIISSPELGVLVPPDDPDALEIAIEGLLQDDERAKALGAALRRRVRESFSWEASYRKYRELCGSLGPLHSRADEPGGCHSGAG